MCGIAGIVSMPNVYGNKESLAGTATSIEARLDSMIGQMQHRGPDGKGKAILSESGLDVALGHTRLAIIDLSAAGRQPMADSGSKSWVIYNGEVYNYKKLRQELGINDKHWQSRTDTEVILKAHEHWGTSFLQKLRGMFAFAIWDGKREQLLLARDPFGIKPLYYYFTNRVIVFASEVRTLLASGLVPRQLNPEGVISYLRFGSIESPLTIIKGVRSLLPGHYLAVKRNDEGLRIKEGDYAAHLFDRSPDDLCLDRKEAVEILRRELEDSVRLHLISDVPIAAFLSGGIDSSAIVALMRRVAEERPRTFTVVFSEKEFSEHSYARLLAERFGTEHREVSLSEERTLESLPKALAAMDQPTIDGINTWVISRAVKEAGITVALSGLGGDELFAGYPSFRRARQLRNLSNIPVPLRKMVAHAGQAVMGNSVRRRKAWRLLAEGGSPQSAYTVSRQLFSYDEVATLIGTETISPETEHLALPSSIHDAVSEVSLYEMQGYMANTLLRDTDQMSMAHSLEVRVPFIDSTIAPFVLGLEGKWKLDGMRPKPLLLDALGDLLPEEIWRRPKMGFTFPFGRWMHSFLQPDIDSTLQDSELSEIGITTTGRSVWRNFQSRPQTETWSRPWSLYVLKKWCEHNEVRL